MEQENREKSTGIPTEVGEGGSANIAKTINIYSKGSRIKHGNPFQAPPLPSAGG